MGGYNSVLIDVKRHRGYGGRAYYKWGKTSYQCSYSGKTIDLSEERRDTLPGYKITKHKKTAGKYYSLYQGATEFHGFHKLEEYSEVYAYFWEGDDDYKRPLIIQLGSGSEYYTSAKDSTTWSRDFSITSDTLLTRLDQENCKKNEAHVMDISKEEEGLYKCPLSVCNKKIVTLSFEKPVPYAHSLKLVGSSITRFENKGTVQNGLPFPRKVDSFYMYLDLKENKDTLLIYVDPIGMKRYWQGYTGPKWYRRDFYDKNTWSEVSGDKKPSSPYDSKKILRILLEYIQLNQPEIEKVQRLEEPGFQDSTPVGHPYFILEKTNRFEYADYGDTYPVFPTDITVGSSVTPYEFDVVVCNRGTPNHEVTVDCNLTNINGDELVTDMYTGPMEHEQITPNVGITNIVFSDSSSEILSSKEVAENIESTGPVTITVPYIDQSGGQYSSPGLEGKPSNGIYRGYSGSPSTTYGGDAVYESYTTVEHEERGCIASDLEDVEESHSNYALFETRAPTQVTDLRTTPVELSFSQPGKYIVKLEGTLPQSGGESSTDVVDSRFSDSPLVTSGLGILVEEDYNTMEHTTHGHAVDHESYDTVDYDEYRATAPCVEIDETEYRPNVLDSTIEHIRHSGVQGSPISDVPKGYFDPPPITSTVQGTPVAEMAEDAIDAEIVKEHLSVQGSSISDTPTTVYLEPALPHTGVDGHPIATAKSHGGTKALALDSSTDPTLLTGVYGRTIQSKGGEPLLQHIQSEGSIPSASIDPQPPVPTGVNGVPIDTTVIVGESPDVIITFDSSPVDLVYDSHLVVGGSNSYQSTEETEPNLYYVEERFDSIIPESIQLDVSHISIDDAKVVDIYIDSLFKTEQKLTETNSLIVESAIAGALGLQALRLVLEATLVPTLVFAEHIFKSAADGILPKEPCPAVTPILPVCVADPSITCCWWWYLLWVIIVLLVIILVCVLCRRSIKVLIIKV
ncbi:hypothetical protein BEWA_013250 [Theileria equi strain WA]|uniref:Uncharacterized protein n=1 Tax=Theileria equi strain WA TaxID=1537102 RepID=L1LBS6_THEEQ|nr:hypothetical protein BEWA_013250 [Theileria equi strain WA]EKX72766.1 hypothetical protein BEWA_013250 [Theileria equi strain WA]|eukprot:XP_004832218.1 hypothetical protein BEWA_013250 [Theileria equi strain WA]